jgi:hypothetical protein
MRWPYHADVREPTGHGCDADVGAGPDVHLAEVRDGADTVEIAANRPPARPRRQTGQAETEGQRRVTPVGGNRDARRHPSIAMSPAREHAGDDARAVRIDDRAARRDAGFEHCAGVDRLLQKHPVQIAAHKRAPVEPAGVPSLDDDAARARHPHPVDAKPAFLDAGGEAQPAEQCERSRIHRVAAQLRPRKGIAIDQAHPCASPRQDRRRNRSSRPGPDHQHVVHQAPMVDLVNS